VLIYTFKLLGLIKDPLTQYDEEGSATDAVRENHYNQRFGCFADIMFPRYKHYYEYKGGVKKQIQDETGDDPAKLFEMANKFFKLGKKFLNNLQSTDAAYRNTTFYQNEELEELQKNSVANSLAIAQIQMKMATAGKDNLGLIAKVDTAKKYKGLVPVITLVEKPQKK